MILHIGGDEYVSEENILMILDAKCILEHPENEKFLQNYTLSEEKMNPGGHFKAVILTVEMGERRVYYSPISAATLRRRISG